MKVRAKFLAAVVLGFNSYAATVGSADTISLYLEDFQASGVLGYKLNGGETEYGSSGIFRLRTSDPIGPLANQVGDPAYAFCIELLQPPSGSSQPYNVGDLTTANDPTSPIAGPITPEKRDLVRQLWSLYFNPSWTQAGPYSTTQITECVAFHASIFEIITDYDDANLTSLDLDSGLFQVVDAYILDINDPNQLIPVKTVASGYLAGLSLNYDGPLAELVALTNPELQDYVAPVPEASTLTLAGIGVIGVLATALRRRRRAA